MKPIISAVVPAFNEAESLPVLLERLFEVLARLDFEFEVVVVDDGSSDSTWGLLETLASKNPRLLAVRLSRNYGKENAICAGLDTSRGDAVVLMDADCQHPPEIIPRMLEEWRQGFKIVEGVKTNRGKESLLSRLEAKTFYYLMGSVSAVKLESASDFKLLDREVVEAWKQLGERNVFFRGMSEWLGYPRSRVEFEVPPRVAGQSTWNRMQLLGLALKAITSFSSVPLRLVTIAGVLFMILAGLLAIQTLYLKIIGVALTGFTTVILLVLISSSLLMLALGVIGEYVAGIYREVKFRPRYIIAERLQGSRTKG